VAVLPDVLFDLLPEHRDNRWPNWLTYGFIGCTSVLVLTHRRRITLTRRLLSWWTCLFILRCSTVTLTSLPDPNHMCFGTNPITDQLASFVSGISCGDMILSGHTMGMMCCAFILIDAFPYAAATGRHIAIHMLAAVWITAGVISLIVTRFHYTVDVVLGLYFPTFVWTSYKLLITEDRIARWRLLSWFEQDRFWECACCYERRNLPNRRAACLLFPQPPLLQSLPSLPLPLPVHTKKFN